MSEESRPTARPMALSVQPRACRAAMALRLSPLFAAMLHRLCRLVELGEIAHARRRRRLLAECVRNVEPITAHLARILPVQIGHVAQVEGVTANGEDLVAPHFERAPGGGHALASIDRRRPFRPAPVCLPGAELVASGDGPSAL